MTALAGRHSLAAFGKFVKLTRDHVGRIVEQIRETKRYSASQLYNVGQLSIQNLQSPKVDTKFYAYEGMIEDLNRACIVAVQYRNFYIKEMITVSAPRNEYVSKGMTSEFSQLVNWNCTNLNAYVPQDFVTSGNLQSVILRQPYRQSKLLFGDGDVVHPLEVSLPEPWKFSKLNESHVNVMLKQWKDGGVGAYEFLTDSLKTVHSWGIFDDNGQLASSLVFGNHGIYCAMVTNPKYTRLGLATQLFLKNVKCLLDQGFMPVGASDVDSVTARIHGNLGIVGTNYLYTIFPNKSK